MRAACEKIGRDPGTMRFTVALVVCVGTDEAEFERRAAAIGHEPDDLRAERGRRARPARSSTASTSSREQGAETVYLQFLDLDDLDHLRLIAAEVVPHI